MAIAALAVSASAGHASAQAPPRPRLDVARDGDGMGTAAIVTPSARARGFVLPQVPSDAVRFPEGVIGLRFGAALVVGTALEAAGAWAWLSSPGVRTPMYRLFRTIDDLDRRDASRREIARVGADAGAPLEVKEDGWSVVCWTCDASEIIPALQALGARPMSAWAWQRMKASMQAPPR